MGNKTALPPNWTVETIGDLGRVITGKTPSTKDPGNFGGTIPFITPSDMDGRKRISRTARFLTDRGATSVSSANIPAGAVMVSCIGSDMGKASIAGCDAVTNQQINSIIVKDVVSADYVYYNLSTRQTEIKHIGSGGSAVPILNKGHFSQLQITLPPLPEQKAIAHILGTLDDKIEVNRRMNETLEGMARALFKSWFVDFDPVLDNALAAGNPIPEEYRDRAAQRADAATSAASQGRPFGLPNPLAAQFPNAFHDSDLGPIPQGWEVRNLGELCAKPQYGYTASAKDEPIGPRFLRIKDINKSPWIEWASVPYCEISDKDLEKYTVYRGDLLIARMADPGHGVLVEGERDAVFASYLIRFRPQNPEHQHYLQLWLKSDGYWQLINSRKTGTTRASLNAQVLSRLPLVVPSSDTCTIFSSIVSRFRKRGNANVEHSESLAALRDTLLPKLLSGELRVNDAEKFVEAAV